MYQFSARTNPPLPTNESDVPFWFSSRNPYYTSGYGLPNCPCYALGRINELQALNGLDDVKIDGTLGNAGKWGSSGYIGQTWKKSSTPFLGSIAVFTRGSEAGHVAIVEEIYENGRVKLSNSGWSSTNRTPSNPKWFWISDNINVKNWAGYTFHYYLLPPYIDGEPTPPEPSGGGGGSKKSMNMSDYIVLALCNALPKNL